MNRVAGNFHPAGRNETAVFHSSPQVADGAVHASLLGEVLARLGHGHHPLTELWHGFSKRSPRTSSRHRCALGVPNREVVERGLPFSVVVTVVVVES